MEIKNHFSMKNRGSLREFFQLNEKNTEIAMKIEQSERKMARDNYYRYSNSWSLSMQLLEGGGRRCRNSRSSGKTRRALMKDGKRKRRRWREKSWEECRNFLKQQKNKKSFNKVKGGERGGGGRWERSDGNSRSSGKTRKALIKEAGGERGCGERKTRF